MSSSYDPWSGTKVLRGHAAAARPAFLDTELGRAPSLSLVAPLQDDEAAVAPYVDPDVSEGYAAGYEEGYAEGHAEGKAVGYAEGYQRGNEEAAERALEFMREREARLTAALDALAAAARACNERQSAAIDDIEHTIVSAIFDLAETVVGRELSHTRTPGRDALARALSMAKSHGPATARLHPDDIETLGDLADIAPGRVIEVVADPEVEPGGCILEAGAQRVDAQIGTAIARAKQALLS
jgi:flagellar assembly protein FliH